MSKEEDDHDDIVIQGDVGETAQLQEEEEDNGQETGKRRCGSSRRSRIRGTT